MVHKDAITGKVFINLIELYKDSKIQQLVNPDSSKSYSNIKTSAINLIQSNHMKLGENSIFGTIKEQ